MKHIVYLITISIVTLLSSCKSSELLHSTDNLRTDGIYFYQEPSNPYDSTTPERRPYHCFRFYDDDQVIEGHTIPHPKEWTRFDIKYPEHLHVSTFKKKNNTLKITFFDGKEKTHTVIGTIKNNQLSLMIYYETSDPNYTYDVSANLDFLPIK